MEVKKNPKANLENKKNIFLEIGFMVALAAVLFAFEWKVVVSSPNDFITIAEEPTEIDMVPVTVMNQLPPPPPPAIRPIEIFQIVEQEVNVNEDLELTDATNDSENPTISTESWGDYPTEEISNEVIPFLPAEDMPVFPGNINKWLSKNIHYPQIAADNGIEGKVHVKFVVERDGSISNVEVLRGVDAALDKEAIRVISSMPKWKPGKQRGKPVRVSYNLPIAFRLNR